MKIEDKLFDIFEIKLQEIESEIITGTENYRQIRLNEKWNEYLEINGINRIGKMMSLLVEKNPNSIWIKDPLVLGGMQGYISISKDTAMKIAALGYFP